MRGVTEAAFGYLIVVVHTQRYTLMWDMVTLLQDTWARGYMRISLSELQLRSFKTLERGQARKWVWFEKLHQGGRRRHKQAVADLRPDVLSASLIRGETAVLKTWWWSCHHVGDALRNKAAGLQHTKKCRKAQSKAFHGFWKRDLIHKKRENELFCISVFQAWVWCHWQPIRKLQLCPEYSSAIG